MKVILIQDVKSLGKKGDVLEVSDGYAKNKLLKGGLALEANGKNLNDLKLQKKHEEKVAQEIYEAAVALAKDLDGKIVKVPVKSGEGGKVFGSVSSKEVAKAAKEQLDLELDKKKMNMPEPLKTLGFHEVPVKLHPKVSAVLRVNVVEE